MQPTTWPLSDKARSLLRRIHVNMPWHLLPRYQDLIEQYRLNLELGFSAADLDNVSRRDFQKAADALARQGSRLTFHGPFWELCPGSCDPLIRQISRLRLAQLFDLITVFRPLQVVCHTGFDPRHHSSDHGPWLERALEVLEPLVDRAEQLNIRLLLENVWESGPALHRAVFDRLPSSHLGFCLDLGHQHAFSSTPLEQWLGVLADRLGEIHVHDNDGSRDAHLPVGAGTIAFPTLFGFLLDRGRRPLLTLEPHEQSHFTASLNGLAAVLPDRYYGAESVAAEPW